MAAARTLGRGEVFKAWWPLAASWLLMALEVPAVSAVIARLPAPEINLAAFGGLVFPLAILVEAPVLMLLGTSTALSRDRASYGTLRAFTSALGAGLTLIHILIVFTPLYYVIAERLMHAPPATVEPARAGLMVMVPYAWAVGYRRLSQGLLIRAGRSVTVGIGTAVRLVTDLSILAAGLAHRICGGRGGGRGRSHRRRAGGGPLRRALRSTVPGSVEEPAGRLSPPDAERAPAFLPAAGDHHAALSRGELADQCRHGAHASGSGVFGRVARW